MSAFERLELDTSNAAELLALYRRWRLLWLRPRDADGTTSGVDALRRVARAVADDGADEFSVENPGDVARDPARDALAPSAVFGGVARAVDAATAAAARLPAHFYVSTVLGGDAAARVLTEAPISEPSFLPDDAAHGTPAWLFVGSNAPSDITPAQSRKRKTTDAAADAIPTIPTAPAPSPPRPVLAGRGEHTDHVACSGTWHHQLSGRKTWYLRPFDRAPAWRDDPPPDVATASNATRDEDEDERGARRRLVVEVEEGDVLLLDTSAWWHETALPSSPTMSASLAREFFLAEDHGGAAGAKDAAKRAEAFTNVDGLYAPRAMAAGDIVCTEKDFEDGGPRVGRSEDPNCAVAEIDDGDDEGDEGGGGTMALVALRDIAAGEFLTVEPSDDDDEDEEVDEEDDDEEDAE